MLILQGCKSTSKPINKPPTDIQVGNVGTQPEKVWKDYNWVIMSKERFIDNYN